MPSGATHNISAERRHISVAKERVTAPRARRMAGGRAPRYKGRHAVPTTIVVDPPTDSTGTKPIER